MVWGTPDIGKGAMQFIQMSQDKGRRETIFICCCNLFFKEFLELRWAEARLRAGKNTHSNFKSWQSALGNFCTLMSSMRFRRFCVCCLSCSRSLWILVAVVLLKTTPIVVRAPELMASGWMHAFTSGLKSLTVTQTLLFHFLLTEHRAEMDAFTGSVTCKALEGVPRNKHGDFSFCPTDPSGSQLFPNPPRIFCG